MTKLDKENVQKHIMKTRLSLLSQYTDISCDPADTLVSHKTLQESINSLATELKLNTTYIPNKNVSNITLEYAARMFIYLNYCPSKLLSFIIDLLRSGKLREILLALPCVNTLAEGDRKRETTIDVLNNILNNLSQREFQKIPTKGHLEY